MHRTPSGTLLDASGDLKIVQSVGRPASPAQRRVTTAGRGDGDEFRSTDQSNPYGRTGNPRFRTGDPTSTAVPGSETTRLDGGGFAVNAQDLAEQLADILAFVAECEDWERKVDAFRYVR
jgi:hypothetical protein